MIGSIFDYKGSNSSNGGGGIIGIKVFPLVVTFLLLVLILSYILQVHCKRCRKNDRQNEKLTCFKLIFPCCP